MAERQFRLVKWYLDCVTDAGDAAILYCAEMDWRGLRASMGSLLTSRGEQAETRTRLGKFALRENEGEITAEHVGLKASGQWRGEAEEFAHTVYAGEAGSVEWHCLQSRAAVTMTIGGQTWKGRGYAERLTLTLPPWRLPLTTLRWGRFVSGTDSLTWIDWEGEHRTRVAVRDGHARELLVANEEQVLTSDAELRMEPGMELRAGRLGKTILPGAPALGRLFPRSIFNVREEKWKCKGVLTGQGGRSEGWVIHEVVHWKG